MKNKYIISKNLDKNYTYSVEMGEYYINHNYDASQFYLKRNKENCFIVIGDFVDSNAMYNTKEAIIEKISESKDISELIKNTHYLAGRYLIFFGTKEELLYVLPDPIVSIPINFSFLKNEFIISSDAKLIAEKYGFSQSQKAIRIKKGAEQQQPLPYNITMYDEVKTLIPNHLLNLQQSKMVRFFPLKSNEKISMDKAVEQTILKGKNIIDEFSNTKKMSLPITSGVDSRAVLALMKKHKSEVKLYTYFHDEFTQETGDIKIPTEIANYFDISYNTLPTQEIPGKIYEEIKTELSGLENDRILRNGFTYSNSNLTEYHPVPGDIISLSKSPFGKNLPERLATLDYFITKTHNYSPEVKEYVRLWMEDVEQYSKANKVSKYDLFNWEYRLGRWLPNNIKNYDYFVEPIYIFNCRFLMELWVSIPKKERTQRSLHMEIIKKEWPELLNFEFNPDDKAIDNMFSNSYLFYIGSFIKYQLKRFKQ